MEKSKERLLILYRLFFMFVTLFIIRKMTTLGDYDRYINKNFYESMSDNGSQILKSSTLFTDTLTGLLNVIFFNVEILVNIFFNLLATYGILKFLRAIKNNKTIYVLLFFPSFTIWSSYASKETIVVFAVGVLMSYLINISEEKKLTKKEKIIFFITVYLIFLFKKQYLLSIFGVFSYIILHKKFKPNLRYFIFFIIFIITIFFLYILREEMDKFFRNFYTHFNIEGASSKNSNYFMEKYGFFKNLFYGMFIGVWGPEISDLKNGILQIFTFIESSVIFIITAIKFFRGIGKRKISQIIMFLMGIFYLLIVQYPFGIFNAGSAVRYRTNLYLIVLCYLYIFVVKNEENRGWINDFIES